MSRSLPWPWLLAGLLVLGSGCQNLATFLPAGKVEPLGEADPPDELPGGLTPVSYRMLPAVPVTDAATLGAPIRRAQAVWLDAPLPSPTVGPVAWRQPSDRPCEYVQLDRPAALPQVVISTARSICSHAADYRWLVGCLQYDSEHHRWSVHYGEEDGDLHEGTLNLVNPGPMTGFCPGQMVRVEGELVDPAPLEIKPGYRVGSLQVLRR